MQIDVLVTFIFSVFLLTITPGPDIIYVFFKSISDGKRSAIELSLGLTSGLLFHTLLVIFGISAILSSDDFYYDIIKYFGFFYFTTLSVLSIIKKNDFKNKKNQTKNNFITGLLMNILNPKVSIFFIAFLPGFIFHDTMQIKLQFLILGLIFWIISTIIFIFISISSEIFRPKLIKLINSKNLGYVQASIYLLVAFYIVS